MGGKDVEEREVEGKREVQGTGMEESGISYVHVRGGISLQLGAWVETSIGRRDG